MSLYSYIYVETEEGHVIYFLLGPLVCVFVCKMCVSPFLISFSSSFSAAVSLCRYKHIVNIMKVYIERNNIQVESIRLRKHI